MLRLRVPRSTTNEGSQLVSYFSPQWHNEERRSLLQVNRESKWQERMSLWLADDDGGKDRLPHLFLSPSLLPSSRQHHHQRPLFSTFDSILRTVLKKRRVYNIPVRPLSLILNSHSPFFPRTCLWGRGTVWVWTGNSLVAFPSPPFAALQSVVAP